MDHRGTPAFPGMVCTLVSREDLLTLELLTEGDTEPSSIGVVYMVEKHAIDPLIAELDFREKGGYTRHWIDIELLQSTPHHAAGSVAKALVYTGSAINPMFYLPKKPSTGLESEEPHHMVDAKSASTYTTFPTAAIPPPSGVLDTTRIAEIIASAVGPSGANAEYLLQLTDYFAEHGLLARDPHLHYLANFVERRSGWRRPRSSFMGGDGKEGADVAVCVVGWGSDEYGQISGTSSGGEKDLAPRPRHVSVTGTSSLGAHLPTLLCGGAHSGVLTGEGRLHLWGADECGQVSGAPPTRSEGEGPVGVQAAALGHAHSIALMSDGSVRAWGDNAHGQCDVSPLEAFGEVGGGVARVAAGLRHSAAISKLWRGGGGGGRLVFWGDNRYGQAPSGTGTGTGDMEETGMAEGVSDVACGARHSVWIRRGQLWTSGDDKHGQRGTGRDASSPPSEGAKTATAVSVPAAVGRGKVRWSRVVSGWSHVVARGVDEMGEIIVVGWGRNSFGQLSDDRSACRIDTPIELPPLPTGPIHEVWCGSEFTAAADAAGRVYMRGWAEHANLGDGSMGECVGWVAVDGGKGTRGGQLILRGYPWAESLALGGSHCLAST